MNMITTVLPLLAFTTFAGAAAGAYALMAVLATKDATHAGHTAAGPDVPLAKRPWLFPLTCIVLLGIGLIATLMHLGQPLRFMNGMSNPASGISQESYWSIAFGAILAADLALTKMKGTTPMPLRWAGALMACGLMVVTGLAYYDCLGIAAWSGAATVPFFVLGDLALGAGLLAALRPHLVDDDAGMAAIAATGIAFVVTIAALGLHLSRIGVDAVAPLAVSGAMAVAAIGAVCAARAGKLSEKAAPWAVCALLVVGVAIARYAFFAVGVA